MINFIVNKFKSFKTTAVEDAVNSANEAMNSLSKSILNGTKQITREDIKNSRRNARFNALSDRINRNIEILKEAARVEVKRYKITKDKSNRDAAQSLVDDLLQYTNEDADTVLGLLNYSKHALTTLRGLSAAFHTINIMTPD
jgi:hypothetical protein